MFGSTNNNNNNAFGGNANPSGSNMFGNQTSTGSSGFSLSNSAPKPATSGFGARTTQTSGTGLFGSSNTSSVLFGNKPGASQSSGGLFGNYGTPQQTQQSNNLFGNRQASGGLFGNSTVNTGASPASSGLFGNISTTAPKTGPFGSSTQPGGLFGNSSVTAQQGSTPLFSNSSNTNTTFNPLINGTPMKQYNFKDLPKSLTDSTKADKTINLTDSSRKRSLSNTQVISQGKSSLMERLGSRFTQSQATYNSEGLFSPKKDLIQSVLGSEKPQDQSLALNKIPHRPFGSNTFSSRSVSAPRSASTDYLKLKVDPSRTEARRIKIFGESGGARKMRILGRDDDQDVFTITASDEEHFPTSSKTPQRGNTDNSEQSETAPEVEETDYWCSPSIEELQALPLRQLAEVPGFTIGRKGCGVIRFDLPVDLTTFWSGLKANLFDNVVKINKNHTVEVYPNGSVPLGTGLNVPATITLEKVFPVTRGRVATNATSKDLENRLLVKKLKELKDMEFITYDPINGSWTFKVKHFSIWGLVDEEDAVIDLEKELSKLKKKSSPSSLPPNPSNPKTEPTLNSAAEVIRTNNMAEDTFMYKKQKQDRTFEFDTTSFIPGSFNAPDLHQFVKPGEDNEEKDIVNTDNILSDIDFDEPVDAAVPSQLPARGDESFSLEDYGMVERQYEPEAVDEQDFEDLDANPSLGVSDDWDRQLELSSCYGSVFADKKLKQTTVYDAPFSRAMTPGELDKLLYGDFAEVVKSNKTIKKELRLENYNFASFTCDNKVLRKTTKTASHMTAKSMVSLYASGSKESSKSVHKKHLSSSKITLRSNGFPKVAPNKELSFRLIADNLGYSFSGLEKTIWNLASVLFDNAVNEDLKDVNDIEVINRVLEIQRREGLISWIKKEIQPEIDTKLDDASDEFEQIFLLLSSFDISSAAKLAIKTNNPFLSVLISLLGSNDPDVKFSASQQLEVWKKNAVLQTIPQGLIKIYYLLKGDLLSSDPIAPITKAVSWKTKLGLLLSYGDLNESLATLLGSFVDSEASLVPDSDLTYFNLLKLFVYKHNSSYNIESIFASLKGSGELDFRIQWYVYEVLVRSTKQMSFGSDNQSLGDQLTLLFSEQLQVDELWEESLFVLSHLQDDAACESSITKLLTSNPALLGDSDFVSRLVAELQIPSTLISETKALYFRYLGDHWNEAKYILESGHFVEAHKTIVTYVAPAAVINNGSKLAELDFLIAQFPEQVQIPEWNIGLGVYKNYLKLVSSKSTISQSALRFLIESLPNMKNYNFKMNVAIKLMASLTAKMLTQLQAKEGSNVMDLDVLKTGKLPLGESERSVVVVLDKFLKREALSY
jgi:nucleoporin NUP145